ncbi:MAG: hypothetical protein ACRD68_05080, partial [Pyrinomonadaceae bacterium]
MKFNLTALFALGVLLSVAGWTVSSSMGRQQQPDDDKDGKPGTIPWHVKKAKAKGEKKVALLPIDDT